MSRQIQRVENSTELKIIPEVPYLERTFFDLTERLLSQGVAPEAISQLTPHEVRVSNEGSMNERTHILLSVEDKDHEGGVFQDVVWFSPATQNDGKKPTTIVLKPGLGEIVESGIGYEFHEEISNLNIFDNVLTHATEGFGPNASAVSLTELPSYNLDRMAERMRRLMQTYCPEHTFTLVGTSMGTVVIHKLQQANLQADKDNQLEIDSVVNYVTAIVDPKNILKSMIVGFPIMMAIDTGLELGIRTNPKRLRKVVNSLIESRPGWKDIPMIGRLALSLTPGVDQEEVFENTHSVQTTTVTGTLDPLKEVPMWNSSNANLCVIKRRGHGMALNPVLGARKITTEIGHLRA